MKKLTLAFSLLLYSLCFGQYGVSERDITFLRVASEIGDRRPTDRPDEPMDIREVLDYLQVVKKMQLHYNPIQDRYVDVYVGLERLFRWDLQAKTLYKQKDKVIYKLDEILKK